MFCQIYSIFQFINLNFFLVETLSLQCWLKKQKDTLAPQRQEVGETVMWTSGLIFGKGEVWKFGEHLFLLINVTFVY